MKQMLRIALALLLVGGAAIAQPNGRDRDGNRNGPSNSNSNSNNNNNGPDRYDQYRNNPGVRMSQPRWSRGDRVPQQFRNNRQYVVNDWQQRHLRRPPRGYHWVHDDNNNYFLAAVTTGVILDLLLNGGR